MVTFLARYKPLLAAFLMLCASPVGAEEPVKSLNFNGKYEIAWSGIPLGRIVLRISEDATHYQMSVDTKTRGIGAIISDTKQWAEARGSVKDGVYIPAFYQSRPQKDPDGDIVTLTYDDKGNLAKRVRTKDDDPNWRPAVPMAEANTGRDPITTAFILRRELYKAVAENKHQISARTYDGLQLATMKVIRDGEARVAIMDSYREAINAQVMRIPMSGYTPKELKNYKKGDPEIHLYFGKDADFIPLRATAKIPVGELSMTLVDLE